MEREWIEWGWWWLSYSLFFQVIYHQKHKATYTNSKISSNDRSRAYFPYNYLISKSVITWQKQKFNRINGWCAHRAHCLNVSCCVRGGDDDDDDDNGGSGIAYVWYIQYIGYDARDILPMLIMFTINECTHMIYPIEISSRFICVHTLCTKQFNALFHFPKKASTKYCFHIKSTISTQPSQIFQPKDSINNSNFHHSNGAYFTQNIWSYQ